MPLSADALVHAVNDRIAAVVSAKRDEFLPLGDDLAPVFNQISSFTEGCKRARARFVAAGAAQAVGQTVPADLYTAIVDAAAGLELFHAAALVHDDVLDRSDTRRGKPATHRVFEQLHRESSFAGEAEHFGTSAAILIGDLLLMWSDDLLLSACAHIDERSARRVRHEYARMRTEVTAGQYLDVLAELNWHTVPVAEHAERAIAIATSKSARYSVESPLVLGALLAGGDDDTVAAIRAYGLPLGLAFQLRDDVLGVFGDSQVTGKPAGDDLREGKRTLLVAEFERRADGDDREYFVRHLGNPELTEADVEKMQQLLLDSGALAAVEARIQGWLEEALSAIDKAAPNEQVRALLGELAERAAVRNA